MTYSTKKCFAATLALLGSLIIANCSSGGTEGYKYITYDLQGEWERDRAEIWPEGTTTTKKGKIVLTSNTIIISGPFKNFEGYVRDTELEAYTEENNLYIKFRDEWQNPIVYRRWKSAGNPPEEMLTIGNTEDLKKK